MYGIMKAGAAYVPLDTASPPARQAFIVRDCSIRHLVTEQVRRTALDALLKEGVQLECIIGLDEAVAERVNVFSWTDVAAFAVEANDEPPDSTDLAYILYTSGSTGVPKGVMHTHRSALAFARVAAETYGFRGDDRLGNHAPLHFDLSTMDYFSAAIAGATTVIIPEAHTRMPASFAALIESEKLTVLYAVPLALTHLLLHGALSKRDISSVRWVLFGGEPFPPRYLRSLMAAMPTARFSNVYGPTEVNGITHYELPRTTELGNAPLPIGIPYKNVELRVVDPDNEPVAMGEVGELLARTPTMMSGYWGRPDLDAAAFWSDPAIPGVVYHRTGDLVRSREDGMLEFHGRKDRQVKSRGYRIELDDVEAAMLSHAAVETAAAIVIPEETGSVRIEGIVALGKEATVSVDDLRGYLNSRLPRYAVPEHLRIVEAMPRTSSGKIDRVELMRQSENAS
jgi:amino acid adenylation domain-containing protein